MRLLYTLGAALVTIPAYAGVPSDFARDVRPVFAKHCVACHNPEKQKGGLRLDTAAEARKGGDTGLVILPGKSAESLLLKAIRGDDPAVAIMPPDGRAKLSDLEVAALVKWIDEGAKEPAGEVVVAAKLLTSTHWAFQPVVRPAVPGKASHADPVSAFVLAKLSAAGLTPSSEADRRTLARRLSLDLLGLPPSPEEVDTFVRDTKPDAYSRYVEKLLASPHYGERQARHWLDIARYADSDGYNYDARRSVWPYRDWVIKAFNADLPYDRFVTEQLAGDLLPAATLDQKIASGFNRNSLYNSENGVDPEQLRNEIVVDRVNTTAMAFLGLTIGCAQCHDHKYDPVTQREYYQLFAFFNRAEDPAPTPVGPAEEVERANAIQAQVAALQTELASYSKVLDSRQPAWEASLTETGRKAMPAMVQSGLTVAPSERREKQSKAIAEYHRSMDPAYRERQAVITAVKEREPKLPTSLVMRDGAATRPNFIHVRGDFLRHGAAVNPGFPAILGGPSPQAGFTRVDLAKWLIDPKHPLTARFAVNRLWQQFFGVGLVETTDDFGTQGSPPSHPELLDWLADEFVRSGWSTKHIIRLIVNSATYRQTSTARSELTAKDPRNRLLGRQARVRLEGEIVRDSALRASGLLTTKVGGPSVFPPQPPGLDTYARTGKKWKADTGPDRYRRGMYTFIYRTQPQPSLAVFDTPEGNAACARRNRSTTPLQALTLANDPAFYECAQALCKRILKDGGTDDASRMELGYRLCLGREPTPAESKAFDAWLSRTRSTPDASTDEAAWTVAARVLLNLDEFITRE